MINTSLFALFGRYKGDASLAGVLENIQRGTYKQFIDETREALASGDKELAAKLKKKLPAFTPTGHLLRETPRPSHHPL